LRKSGGFRWCRNFVANKLFLDRESAGRNQSVRMMLTKRPLRLRVVALAAAYAIALAGLIGR